MPVSVRDAQTSFSGGLNTVSDPIALQANQVRRATNARLTEYGGITKRNGSVKLASAAIASAVQNGFTWFKDDGTAQALAVANGTLYTLNPLAAIGSQTWASQSGALSSSVTPSFAEFLETAGTEVVFIADGGLLNYWNGSALTLNITGTQDCQYIKVHNERLWGAGSTTNPDSVFYSALNKGETLGIAGSGGGEIIVRTFSDERIVGLASVGSSLLIFHRRGISRLTGFGQDDITVQPEGVSSQTGTIAPFSIVETDGAAYFISDRGAFVANESSVAPLGRPDQPDPILPLVAGLSATQLAQVRGVLSRKTQEVWFYIPGQGVFVYHLILGAWAGPWNGEHLTTNAMWSSPVSTYAEQFVLRTGTDGVVTVADFVGANSDAATVAAPNSGTSITMTVQLRRLYFDDDSIAKSLRFAYVTAILAASQNIVVSWETNFGTYPSKTITGSTRGVWGPTYGVWGVGLWSAPTGSQSYRAQFSGTGYYVDVTLTHTGYSEPVISRFQLSAFALGRR